MPRVKDDEINNFSTTKQEFMSALKKVSRKAEKSNNSWGSEFKNG